MKFELQNINKTFGETQILKNISLQVDRRDIVALIGKSGSGKSTLLKCINLLEIPDSGCIILDDTKIDFSNLQNIKSANPTEIRKKIGMVFQQFHLWPHLTILQNLIKAPIHVLKITKEDAIIEAKILLAKFGLLDKINGYPAELSGGGQQRIAIARTLMMHPEIILFDEPTSALDPIMTQEVSKIIKNLASDGMTVIVSTHEIHFARDVANRAIFIEHGEVVENGYAHDILFHPKTQKLQNFLTNV